MSFTLENNEMRQKMLKSMVSLKNLQKREPRGLSKPFPFILDLIKREGPSLSILRIANSSDLTWAGTTSLLQTKQLLISLGDLG